MATSRITDPKLLAMLELERRGELPEDLASQLSIAREQGVVPARGSNGAPPARSGGGGARGGASRTDQAAAVEAFSQQLARTVQLYNNDLRGRNPLEALPLPSSRRFDAAAAGLSDQALAAFRVPGQGSQSDRELAAFIAANQPGASEYDETNVERLRNIQTRLDARRQALGLPRFNYQTGRPFEQAEGGDPASAGAASQQPQGGAAPTPTPSPGGPTPTDPNVRGEVVFNDQLPDQRADAVTATPEQQAELVALAKGGASPDVIRAFFARVGVRAANDADIATFLEGVRRNPNAPISWNIDNSIQAVDAGDGAAGAAARGALDTLTLGFGDELTALGATVTGDGSYADNLNRTRGYAAFDDENHGFARGSGQVIGGLLTAGIVPSGATGAARTAGVAALRQGLGREAAELAAARAYATRVGAEGAAYGGAYGFGSGDDGLESRAVGAVTGAAAGAAGGYTMSRVGNAAANRLTARAADRAARPATEAQELQDAAARQGIDLMPADVGGATTRRATSAAAQTLGGAQPIAAGARRVTEQAAAARDRVAAAIGAPVDVELAGETARTGAQAFTARTGARGNALYRRAEGMAGQARVETPEALRVIEQEIAPLAETPGGAPGLDLLEGLRDALAEGGTVRGLRNMRTGLRDEFQRQGLRGSNIERIAGRVVDAASDDIVNGLRAQGLDDAAQAYRVADRYWRERLTTIDDHLEPILGNDRSGEQIVQSLTSAMSGNNRRFAGFVNALPAEEQGIVRASLISRIGRATSGQQDQTGEAFSLSTFLSNYDKIGARARRTLFGEEGAAAMNDLARVASGARAAQRYANHSNTGGVVVNTALLGGLGTFSGWMAPLAAGVAQYGAGRLLASPRFARWLARAPRAANLVQQQRHVAMLGRIARAEPAIAQDVLGLQRQLQQAFGAAPARLAAEQRDGGANVVNGQGGQQQRQPDQAQP